MVTIKQKNEETGEEEEVEVILQKEVDEKNKELEEEHNNKITEKDTLIDNLTKEKTDLEDKIKEATGDGVKEDHPNFKILKEALTKKDEEIAGIKTELETDRKNRKDEAMDSAIKIIAKGDKVLEDKIKLNLKETLGALPDGTQEERKIKLDAALKLSADFNSEGIFDGGINGQGKGNIDINDTNKVEFTSNEVALGNKMGISDEDRKKFGSKLTIKIKK